MSNHHRELGKEEAVIFAGDFNSLPTMEPYLMARLVFLASQDATEVMRVTYLGEGAK